MSSNKMSNSVKTALITGVFSLLSALLTWGATNQYYVNLPYSNSNNNINTNTNTNPIYITINGKELSVTTPELKYEIQKLESDRDNWKQKYETIINESEWFWLSDLEYISKDGISTKADEYKTNTGNIIEHCLNADSLTGKGSIEYFIDKKYSTLQGVLAIVYEHRNANAKGTLHIYADDVEIGTLKISGSDLPIEFDYDISEYTKLKLELETTFGSGTGTAVHIGNAKLLTK